MLPKSRKQEADLARELNRMRETAEMTLCLELLDLLLSGVKDELVTATPETFMKKQGEAVAYERLIRMILRTPPRVQE
jgi:hypothetical protein